MFSHITVGVSDLETAGRFYDAVLSPLGLINRPVTPDGGPASLCWIHPDHNLPRFYTYLPFNGAAASAGNGSMVAFLAPTPEAVDQAFRAALTLGGRSEGEPGLRKNYGDNYYGAYFRDPDGNKIHIVCRDD